MCIRDSTSPICDCGSKRETADHFLFHCTKYQHIRKDTIDLALDILNGSRKSSLLVNFFTVHTYSTCLAFVLLTVSLARLLDLLCGLQALSPLPSCLKFFKPWLTSKVLNIILSLINYAWFTSLELTAVITSCLLI